MSGVTANEGLEGGGTTGDITVGIADAGISYAKLAAAAVASLRNGLAATVNVAALAGATFTGAARGIDPVAAQDFVTKSYADTNLFRWIDLRNNSQPYAGWSANAAVTEAELLAGESSRYEYGRDPH